MRAERIETFRQLSEQIEELFEQGKDAEGEALLRQATLEAADDEAYHRFFLSEAVASRDGNFKEQEKLLTEAVALQPDDYFLQRSLGVSFLLQRREVQAIACFRRAVQLNEKDSVAYRYLGLACSNQGKEQRAQEWYGRALTLNPADFDSLRQMGISCSKRGQDAQAVVWYEKALAVNPEDFDAMRQLGVSLAALGELRQGREWVRKGIAIRPDDGVAARNMKTLNRMIAAEEGLLAPIWRRWHRFLRFIVRLDLQLSTYFHERGRGL